MKIILRDIMQAYTQSKTEFNHTIICHLPVKLKKRYPEGTILLVVKLLYGLVETRNYWFVIYLDHHKEKLKIEMLSFDTYLLITKDSNKNFAIAKLQMDNTLNIEMEAFMKKKEIEIIEANFKAKTQIILNTSVLRNFNSYYMIITAEFIMVVQKNQIKKCNVKVI